MRQWRSRATAWRRAIRSQRRTALSAHLRHRAVSAYSVALTAISRQYWRFAGVIFCVRGPHVSHTIPTSDRMAGSLMVTPRRCMSFARWRRALHCANDVIRPPFRRTRRSISLKSAMAAAVSVAPLPASAGSRGALEIDGRTCNVHCPITRVVLSTENEPDTDGERGYRMRSPPIRKDAPVGA